MRALLASLQNSSHSEKPLELQTKKFVLLIYIIENSVECCAFLNTDKLTHIFCKAFALGKKSVKRKRTTF